MRLSIRTKLFLMFFSVIVLVSGSIGSYFYMNARSALMTSLQQRLQSSAALIARNLRADVLRDIDDASDVAKPAYQQYLAQLREWVHSNADLAFIYVYRLRDSGQVEFVIDSDESEKQAKPGLRYEPVNARLLAGFDRPSVGEDIVQDPWGYFLTGYAPIQGGRGEYLVGVDMRADQVEGKFRELHLSGAVSLGLSVLLAWLFSAWFSRQYLRPVHAVIARCQEIADGHYGERIELSTRDELDTLIGAFNRMSGRLQEDDEAIQAAQATLSHQQQDMERQVQHRLADLTALNSELLQENRQLRLNESLLNDRVRRDELTGLYNQRAIMELLEEQRNMAQRGGRRFAVVLILIEPESGQDGAVPSLLDEALRRFVRNLEPRLRSGDLLARLDARQLLILMPNTSEAEAERLAVSLAEQVGVFETLSHGNERLSLTRYFGVAEFRLGEAVGACLDRAWLSLPR